MKKNVMIIDDSALMRRVMSDIINQTDKYQVNYTATNGEEGLEIIQQDTDIQLIFLDMHMPKMNGLEFMRKYKELSLKIPVVVFSTVAKRSSAETIEALSLGALDFLKKPERLFSERERFMNKVMRVLALIESIQDEDERPRLPIPVQKITTKGKKKIVAIACSTGGPKALHEVIPAIPTNINAPIVVVQHMPEGFTKSLAHRLNEISDLSVEEAQQDTILKKGHVYIACGGKHLKIGQKGADHIALLDDDPPVNGLKPFANFMYKSLIDSQYDEIICVIMTGMGSDGTQGIMELSQYKTITVIAQNQESSVVYGMPKMIAQAGLADEIVSLDNIADTIIKYTGVC